MTDLLMTAEGLAALDAEIERLQTVERYRIAERIKEARGFGDLSENAEYDAAKEEQAHNEGKLAALLDRRRRARVIDENMISGEVVEHGVRVQFTDLKANRTTEFHIVSTLEARPGEGKLSGESPVARALMGHRVGDTVEVVTPAGKRQLRIEKITA